MLKVLGQPLTRTLSSLLGINFLVSGLSFVTTLSIAVILGSREFGIFSYALALGGYLTTIANYGMEQTLVRDLAQNRDSFDDHLSASFVVRGFMMILAVILLLVENAVADGDSRLALAGLMVAFLDGIKAFYLPQVYDVWNKMERHALYYLIERCIYFALLWMLIALSRKYLSIASIASVMGISTVISFVIQYAWALPRMTLRLNDRVVAIAKSMFAGNFWIWLAMLSTLSFGGLSKLVLQHVSGSSQLGQYSVAWQIVTLGSLVTAQTARIGFPRMAQAVQHGTGSTRTRMFIAKYFTLSVLAAAVIGLPAILFPGLLLKVLGSQYQAAAAPLRVLGVYVILLGVGQVGLQFLISSKRSNLYATVMILTGALSPVLYALLVPRLAGYGAAIAVVLAHGLAILICGSIMLRDLLFSRRLEASKGAELPVSPA